MPTCTIARSLPGATPRSSLGGHFTGPVATTISDGQIAVFAIDDDAIVHRRLWDAAAGRASDDWVIIGDVNSIAELAR